MLNKAQDGITHAITHLEVELSKLQLGRANPSLVEDLLVENYGALQPLKNMASVGVLDSQTISIKPWDRSSLHAVAKAISDSQIGLNPQSMADSIMIKVPALTEERRIEIAKVAKRLAEEAKVSVRNARQDSHKLIKTAEENKEISEDEEKDYNINLQEMVDNANSEIDTIYKKKQEDIMKV